MKTLRFGPDLALAAAVVTAFLAGCTTTGNDGKVRGGAGTGWENFRAEALPAERVPWRAT